MPADPSWECLRAALQFTHNHRWSKYFNNRPEGIFEPGDFAYISTNFHSPLNELLEERGIPSFPVFDNRENGRYCVVLRKLGSERYLVCYVTTFGGSKHYTDITNPAGRLFGLPLGAGCRWPGILGLRTKPRWLSHPTTGAFILGIPVVREGLQASNLSKRIRMYPYELQRAAQIIRKRLEITDRELRLLRARYIRWLGLKSFKDDMVHHNRRNVDTSYDFPRGSGSPKIAMAMETSADRQLIKGFYRVPKLKPTATDNDIAWLLRFEEDDVLNRSVYLNTLRPKPSTFVTLPKPYFAQSLRSKARTLTRLIR